MSLYPLSRPCPKCGAKPQEFCRNTPAEPCSERWETPMNEIDTDKLVDRLRESDPNWTVPKLRNPDGPDAADAILAMAEEIKELRDCLGFWAARQTCEEALADTTPAPWRNCSPQQRLEIIGARKELHDSEVLKARRALGKDKA